MLHEQGHTQITRLRSNDVLWKPDICDLQLNADGTLDGKRGLQNAHFE